MLAPIFVANPAIVCEAAAYVTGNVLGGKLTMTGIGYNQPVILRSATVRSVVSTSIAWDLFLFEDNPSATTFTERSALNVVAADIAKINGVINFATGDLRLAAAASMGIWNRPDLFLPIRPVAVGTIYAALVARGSITMAAVGNVSLELAFELR